VFHTMPGDPKCFQFNCLPNYVACGDLVLNLAAKPLETGWLQLPSPSPPLAHYEGFWCGFSPDLPNRVAAPIWPLSGFHPPANWRWQPRVLNKKTKRFTKGTGMVLKYHQEILYPTKQANWRAAESSPFSGVLKRPLHLQSSIQVIGTLRL
jgi:hypothetical protein